MREQNRVGRLIAFLRARLVAEQAGDGAAVGKTGIREHPTRWVSDDDVPVDRFRTVIHRADKSILGVSGISEARLPPVCGYKVVSRGIGSVRVVHPLFLVTDLGAIDLAGYRAGLETNLPIAGIGREEAQINSRIARRRDVGP